MYCLRAVAPESLPWKRRTAARKRRKREILRDLRREDSVLRGRAFESMGCRQRIVVQQHKVVLLIDGKNVDHLFFILKLAEGGPGLFRITADQHVPSPEMEYRIPRLRPDLRMIFIMKLFRCDILDHFCSPFSGSSCYFCFLPVSFSIKLLPVHHIIFTLRVIPQIIRFTY